RAPGYRPSPSPHGTLLKRSRLLPAATVRFNQKRGAPDSRLKLMSRGLGGLLHREDLMSTSRSMR
ncbi:hypothetical protein NQZ68_018736, partial [Dissostichus eleginoides]